MRACVFELGAGVGSVVNSLGARLFEIDTRDDVLRRPRRLPVFVVTRLLRDFIIITIILIIITVVVVIVVVFYAHTCTTFRSRTHVLSA